LSLSKEMRGQGQIKIGVLQFLWVRRGIIFSSELCALFSHQNGIQHVDLDLQLQGQIRAFPEKMGFFL